MRTTVELNGQKASYIKAIDVLNTNLSELEKELAKVPEVGELTLPLLQRLNAGLLLRELFAERAEEYIAACTPTPLESMKKVIRADFTARIPSDRNIHDRIDMVHDLLGWYESQTGTQADIVRVGNNWQVSEAQKKRLIASCTVTLSAKQATYIAMLDDVVAARNKLAEWEMENDINPSTGISYMAHPDTVYSLVRAI